MKILLDQNMNPRIRRFLPGHFVVHAQRVGWERFEDTDLLRAAERHEYDVIITADKRIEYQQNHQARRIAIVLLEDATWKAIQAAHLAIRIAVEASSPGSFELVPSSPPQS